MERDAYNILIIRLDGVVGGADAAASAIASLLHVSDDVAARAVRAVPGVVPVEVDRAEAQAFVLALRDAGIDARAVAMARRTTGRLTATDGVGLSASEAAEDWARTATSGVRAGAAPVAEPAPSLRPASMESGDWARVASSGMRMVSARRQGSPTGSQGAVPTPMSQPTIPVRDQVLAPVQIPIPVPAAAQSSGAGTLPTPPARPGLADSAPIAPVVGTADAIEQHEMARLDETVGQPDPFALDDLPELVDPNAPPTQQLPWIATAERREQPFDTSLQPPSPAPQMHTPSQRGVDDEVASTSAAPHAATAFAPAFRGSDEPEIHRASVGSWSDAEVEDAGWGREDSLPKLPALTPREMMETSDGSASPSVLGGKGEAPMVRMNPHEELASLDPSEEFPVPSSVEDFFASMGTVEEPPPPTRAGATESAGGAMRVGIPLSQFSSQADAGEGGARVGRSVVPAAPQLGVTHSSLEDELLEVSGLYALDGDRGPRRDRNTAGSVAVPIRATTRMQAVPAKKPVPVVAIAVTILVVLILGVAGKLAWDAKQRQSDAWLFAKAPSFVELAVQTQGAVSYRGCARLESAWLCRFDADYYRAILPGLSQAVSRQAARNCFARSTTVGGASAWTIRCTFQVDGEPTQTLLHMDWERSCSTALAEVADQGVTPCTVRGETRAVLAEGQILTSQYSVSQDWRHQADRRSGQTEGGHLPVREFVVTASGAPTRTVWYSTELETVVTTRTIGGLPTSSYDGDLQLTWRVDGGTEHGAPRQDWGR